MTENLPRANSEKERRTFGTFGAAAIGGRQTCAQNQFLLAAAADCTRITSIAVAGSTVTKSIWAGRMNVG
jgi:hypothetical protein